MTRRELEVFYVSLGTVKDLKGKSGDEAKFPYAVARNRLYCEPEIKSHAKAIEPSKEYLEFEAGRGKLLEKYCNKDENGKPKRMNIGPNRVLYEGIDGNKPYEEESKKLEKEFKAALEDREKQGESYEKLMDEDVIIEIHKIKLAVVPEDITPGQMEALILMIDEE